MILSKFEVIVGDSNGLDQLVLLLIISYISYLCLLNVALWLDIELVLTA